ncbi:type II toxin-antitoxin system RelE/ParE family toxin [Solimonas marina]|uniref:Type II toxin-antitoxin system RelE/ParE family toxin n=1 Tax=Solimonas marina TaxID=2714601 RepID=A0A970B9V3_9GAMM|nr:type II toxin-antitoxin system RelE/ParE family toxin [Solimonas marina]
MLLPVQPDELVLAPNDTAFRILGQRLAYYRQIVEAFEHAAGAPERGRDRSLFGEGMRSVNCQKHVIFYKRIKAADDAVVVLRIVHQQRNLPALAYYDDLDAPT